MTVAGTKLLPATLTCDAPDPVNPDDGFNVIAPGAGLFTAKAELDEIPPPGAALIAAIANVPELARSAALSNTFMLVLLTKVEGRAAPFTSRLVPATKPDPVIVTIVAAEPALPVLGETEVIVGAGLFTENAIVPEAPPPGWGLTTFSSNGVALAKSFAVRFAVN